MAQGCSSVRLPHSSHGRTRSVTDVEDGGEPLRLFRRLLEQMKGEPLGRLPADPREPGEFGDQLLDGAHRSEGRA